MTNIYQFPGVGDNTATQGMAELDQAEAARRAAMLAVLDEIRTDVEAGSVRAMVLATIDHHGADRVCPGIGLASPIEFRGLCDVLVEYVRMAEYEGDE